MRKFTQNLCFWGAFALVFLGVAVFFFSIIKMTALALFCIALVIVCLLFLRFEIRDYRFYQKLSSDMQGKSLKERLQILNQHEECWLLYATADELKYFRDMSKVCSDNQSLNYLLERAAMHGK